MLYAAHVVLAITGHKRVNYPQSNIIYSAFVLYDTERVDLMYKYSGLTESQISNGTRFEIVKEDIKYFIKHYKIVGCDIKNDLKSLELEYLSNECIDIQNYYTDKKGQPISLKILAYAILNKKIHDIDRHSQPRKHTALTDALVTIKLFHLRRNKYVQSESDSDDGRSFEWCRRKVRRVM